VTEPFFKVEGHKCTSKNYRKYLWFVLATVTSQALKYDVITCTPSEGLKQGLKHAGRMWPARTFCAARDAFWGFSNDYYFFIILIYSNN